MKSSCPFIYLFATALLVTSTAAVAQTTAPASTPGAAHSSVPQNVLDPLIGEPERHFSQASSSFIRGDNVGAASEIRSGAALVRLEAGRGATGKESELQSSADQLDQLATGVERADVASRRELNLAFARADLALAAHYRALADRAIADQQHDNAGRWLKAASDYVENASQWAGQPPLTAQSEAQDQARALEAKIRRGANWSYDEAKKGVGYLGTQIQDLGTQMQKFGTAQNSGNTTQ